MKRYIVGINHSSKEQNDLMIELIRKHGLGWWHWLDNMWLLVDKRGQFTAMSLLREIQKVIPDEHKVIIELGKDNDTWAGFGPNSEKRDMFKWLNDNWTQF